MYIDFMVFPDTQDSSLKKTVAEKELLINIQALEDSISSETDENRKSDLMLQLKELKGNLSRMAGASYSEIKAENRRLKEELEKAKQFQHINASPDSNVSSANSFQMVLLREKLYKILLSKYSRFINENEQKTVGEIKSLISKDDLTIVSIADQIGGPDYNYERHFVQAAEKAFNYVRDNINFVDADLNISFWLSPKDIVGAKIGDAEDQAVFLCSLLYALGDDKAECVIAEMTNSKTHAFVITELNNKFLLLDPVQKTGFRDFYGEKAEVIGKYSYAGATIKRFMYKFNASVYEQF